MKEIYNVLEDLFRRCLKKSNVFSFYFERYESKSLALKTPNQNTSIWVFLKQIMLVGKCRLLILLCNRLFRLATHGIHHKLRILITIRHANFDFSTLRTVGGVGF